VKKILICVIIILMASMMVGCDNSEGVVYEEAWAMDTRITISIFYAEDSGRSTRHYRNLARQGAQMAYMFDELFNKYAEGSDIWRINHAGGEYVEVDGHTIAVLQHALNFREISNGRFDVTIGAVTYLWDFGFHNEGIIPPRADIDRALESVGAAIYIDGNRVRLGHPETRLDLGGIAKGYAADYVAAFLEGHGVNAIVNFFGDIVLVGEHPVNRVWTVGTRDPLADEIFGETLFVLQVEGGNAVVGSGTTSRYFIRDGRRFHHILDVDTGEPVISPFVHISVVAPSGLIGEFLTTVLYTMDDNASFEIAQMFGEIYAVMVDEAGNIWNTPGVGYVNDPNTVIPIFMFRY